MAFPLSILRRLGTESRKNNVYKAFRELGRVIRTITLLRFISEPELREEITAATNKAEAYQGFSAWLRFGHEAIERNDPAEQEKIIKFNTLLANCVIFHTALDMTAVLRQLADEGWPVTPAAIANLSPYIRERIKRFGEYATDGLTIAPRSVRSAPEPTPRRRRRTGQRRDCRMSMLGSLPVERDA